MHLQDDRNYMDGNKKAGAKLRRRSSCAGEAVWLGIILKAGHRNVPVVANKLPTTLDDQFKPTALALPGRVVQEGRQSPQPLAHLHR